jgi:YVTN family beta-propeller protein
MMRRINVRLVFLLVVVAGIAAINIAKEHRPSFLRPGLRLMAYVTNAGDGTVSAVDLVQLAVTATIPVGPAPSGIRAHPTRDEIWGVSSEGGFVWVIDAPSGQVAARVPVGGSPFAIDFSPNGMHAYVAAAGTRTLFAIHCETRRIVGQARVGRRPWVARVSPDGELVVVPNREDATVTVLDAATLAVQKTIAVAPQPEQVIILPYGSKAFVSAASGVVSVVDLEKGVLLANLSVQGQPTDLLMTADTGQLIVPTPSNHGIGILYTSTNEYGDHVLLGTYPWRASLTAGKDPILYVSDAAAGRVMTVDFNFRRPGRKAIMVGQRPGVSRLTPGDELLLVVNEESNDLAVIRTYDNSLLTLIPVGRRPRDLAIKVF